MTVPARMVPLCLMLSLVLALLPSSGLQALGVPHPTDGDQTSGCLQGPRGYTSRSLQGMIMVPTSPDTPDPPPPPKDTSPSKSTGSSFEGFFSFSGDVQGIFPALTSSPREVGPPEITARLRRAAFAGDVDAIASILNASNDILKLAAGLEYNPEDRAAAVRKTDDRNQDPDVAVLKGIAKSSLETGLTIKLARIMSISYSRGAILSLLTTIGFEQSLRDTDLMAAILGSDANTEFTPSTGRRRLACDGCSPVNSFVCANCWPSTVCADLFWCEA